MVVKIYGSCYDGFHRPVDCNDTGDHDKPRVKSHQEVLVIKIKT